MQVMRTVITAKRLWDGRQRIEDPFVTIEDGRIALIGALGVSELPVDARVVDFPGATLGPALVDVHTHGGAGHDVMEATPEALAAICGFMGAHGTGGFLATTVTAPLEATLRSLEGLAAWMEEAPHAGQARMLGIHLEGPFLSHVKRGAHPPEYLLQPDIATFDRLCEAAQGRVRLMTLAPELPGAAELAAHATARGGAYFRGPLECDGEGDAGRDCGGGNERHTYLQRDAGAGPPGAGDFGNGADDRGAVCGVDLRRDS